MARTRKGSTSRVGGSKFGSFTTVDFTDQQRTEINEWLRGRSIDFQSVLPKMVEAGTKVSFSYSEHYSCYFGTLTVKSNGAGDESVSYGLRHTDFDKLLGILSFVFESYLSGGDGTIPSGSPDYAW